MRLIELLSNMRKESEEFNIDRWVVRNVAGKYQKPEKINIIGQSEQIILTVDHEKNVETIYINKFSHGAILYNFLCYDKYEDAVKRYNSSTIFEIKEILKSIDELNKKLINKEKELLNEDLTTLRLSGDI